MPLDAPAGSHVDQRAEHAKGIHVSRRARRPAAHRHQHRPGRLSPTGGPGAPKADFRRLLARRHEAVSGKQSGLTGRSALIHAAYMMHVSMCLRRANGHGSAACGAMPELAANTPPRV